MNPKYLIGAAILALFLVVCAIFAPNLIIPVLVCAGLMLLAALALAVAYREWKGRGRSVKLMANINEGIHGDGHMTKKATAAITTRYLLCKFGADVDHIAVNSVLGEKVLFLCTDEPQAAEELVDVAVLGCADGTIRMVLGGTVALGDSLMADGAGKAILLAGASRYEVGIALQAGAANDVIEVATAHPYFRA